MNTIVIVLDSLRRDHLGCYGSDWIETPNIDRFAEQSVVFTQAYCGSYPCGPARRDVWTGRYDFPHQGWGPMGQEEEDFAKRLKDAGKTSMMISDNWLLLYDASGWSQGNYQHNFTGWEFIRGHEGDNWITDPRVPIEFPCAKEKLRSPDKMVAQYLRNCSMRRTESDHPGAKTMVAAMDWLEANYEQEDFVLWVDNFHPHEPFDCPKYYWSRYDDPDYDGEEVIYPQYGPCDYMTEAELNHVKALYAGKVTMLDYWTGMLLDRIRTLGLMENTTVILTTDHGYLFGEHDTIGKPWRELGDSNMYQELAHIPCIIHHPGCSPGRRDDTLMSFVDLNPTILENAGISPGCDMDGVSILPRLEGDPGASGGHEHVFFGRHGEAINVTDGEWVLFRWAEPDEELSALYNLKDDYAQQNNLIGKAPDVERRLNNAIREWLVSVEARYHVADRFRPHLLRPIPADEM